MPRGPSLRNLSLTALREELERRRSKLPRLERQAKRLLRQLAALNSEITALGGTMPAAPGKPGRKPGVKTGAKPGRKPGRPPKIAVAAPTGKPGRKRGPRPGSGTLGASVAAVMSKTDAMNVAQVRDALIASGYPNPPKTLTTMLYQVLGRDPRFKRAGRGKYLLKD